MKKYENASIEVIVPSTEEIMWTVLNASGEEGYNNYTSGQGAAKLSFEDLML